jgi:competence protein ComEC
MHLAVVSSIIAFFLRKPLGKKAAALLGAFFIVLYVLLVGPQPSLVRAALMYLLGALAVLGALPRRPLLLLAQAFLLQILTDPASGRAVSFILSYLALAGILIQGETIGELFRGKVPPVLAQGLAASLGAFIATGAVTAAFFGKLYPVGIVAGLLIVPLTTLFMILSLGILVIDLILPLLTGPLSAFLSLLYGILEQVVSLASRAPAFPVSSPLPALLLSGAAAVFLFLLKNHYLARRQRLVPFD